MLKDDDDDDCEGNILEEGSLVETTLGTFDNMDKGEGIIGKVGALVGVKLETVEDGDDFVLKDG